MALVTPSRYPNSVASTEVTPWNREALTMPVVRYVSVPPAPTVIVLETLVPLPTVSKGGGPPVESSRQDGTPSASVFQTLLTWAEPLATIPALLLLFDGR